MSFGTLFSDFTILIPGFTKGPGKLDTSFARPLAVAVFVLLVLVLSLLISVAAIFDRQEALRSGADFSPIPGKICPFEFRSGFDLRHELNRETFRQRHSTIDLPEKYLKEFCHVPVF